MKKVIKVLKSITVLEYVMVGFVLVFVGMVGPPLVTYHLETITSYWFGK